MPGKVEFLEPGGTPDVVVLSPHPDDAVLSCGGAIAERVAQGGRVLVVTVFTADPVPPLSELAVSIHRDMGLDSVSNEARREEDRRAVARLGAELVQWDLPDALYRRAAAGGDAHYPSLRELFGPVYPPDWDTTNAVLERIRALPPHAEVWGPASIGGHVDHRLVRQALDVSGREVVSWYEDFPYARKWGARLKVLPWWRRRSRIVPLSAASFEAKCEAILAYASQVGPLFGDASGMRSRVRASARRCGGERQWSRLPPLREAGARTRSGRL